MFPVNPRLFFTGWKPEAVFFDFSLELSLIADQTPDAL
jgi:hypothetical protein